MKKNIFFNTIKSGIPNKLPKKQKLNNKVNHAPAKQHNLNSAEIKLALQNALRYFPQTKHRILIKEFKKELNDFGKIYMYRFKPKYNIIARDINNFPHKSKQAAAIMLMICNNLDKKIAQHPDELITYGGNGSVFQNWAQYLLTMQYLSEMTDEQTLVLYSGHPLGLFPSHQNAPRVVVTNGMMIPNYSNPKDYNKYNALGVTQYGQMTAGSFMYIGPQGIVHGTTITILNASRMLKTKSTKTKLFLSSGLGGMSGAQPKAAKIAGLISLTVEVNKKAIEKRLEQGWIDEMILDLDKLIKRIRHVQQERQIIAIGFLGNIIDVWEKLYNEEIFIDIASDQTSLHNPFQGGYYPNGISFAQANKMIKTDPSKFKKLVQKSLIKHVNIINKHVKRGTYFFDYGNAFLLEAKRAGANIINSKGNFIYPSYVQDIMGPLCFDYGFGPFRWICASNKITDLEKTDLIAEKVLEKLIKVAEKDIRVQMQDNIDWIKAAKKNRLVVGSKARILYANSDGRIAIALAFNKAIKNGEIGPIIIGRDHHGVSGTDSPYRETSNIYDGSQYTSDMAIHNVIGDSFRGASWVSIHNGGGVGWGEVINGGFGLLLDGSKQAEKNLKSMLHWDVNNGIARRSWARNEGAIKAIKTAMKKEKLLKITLPNIVAEDLIKKI
ncbi:MAG: urocanate hydratase [Flavobacteriales bacterium TMED191]|nr:MAG: urocanate hydratase [Flavobacteriales bacterium TMED191]